MTPRIAGILNLVTAEKIGGHVSKPKGDILKALATTVVDVSQNPCRKNFTPEHGTNHTMCTSSMLVHLGKFRTVLPAEMMMWQGHNIAKVKFPAAEPSKAWRVLAGEGMALPCLGTVIFCLLLNGAWTAEAGHEG